MIKSKEKIKIEKEIFHKISYSKKFTWVDIKHLELQDEDVINAGYDEGFYTENNSMDAHYYIIITRMIEETDEEFNKRQKEIERDNKWAKERRYESYLKLKKEFENES